jgi:hypothetical protein
MCAPDIEDDRSILLWRFFLAKESLDLQAQEKGGGDPFLFTRKSHSFLTEMCSYTFL